MVLWLLGFLFFAMTFPPRFFKLMNFGYGYLDLGLYSQYFFNLSKGFFDPYIPTFGQTFFFLRPEPLLLLFWPISFITIHPALMLFVDEACVIIAAAVCANFCWRKTQESSLSIAVFVAVLISPLYMDSLHGAASVEILSQPFLALLFTEYFSRRRPLQMTLWFGLLCLLNLNFYILAALLVPLTLFTQRKRWNLERRARVAVPVLIVGIVAATIYNHMNGEVHFDLSFFWPRHNVDLTKWFFCFWFVPFVVPDVLLISIFLLLLTINGTSSYASLIVVLGVLSPIIALERFKVPKSLVHQILSAGLIASCLFYNLTSQDPFFRFWDKERWAISEDNQKVHELMAKIQLTDKIAVSDIYTPLLANHLSMKTLASVNFSLKDVPDVILTHGEKFNDFRYREIDGNLRTGARLLVKTK